MKMTVLLGVLVLAAGWPASALAGHQAEESVEVIETEEVDQQAGQAADADDATVVRRTVVTSKEVMPSAFRNEAVGIKPQFGLISMADALGANSERGVAGLTIDINVLSRPSGESADATSGRPFFGPSLGALYSHLGFANSDFFGMNGPNGNDRGTHLLILPINAKLGYTIRDIARISVHGGANVLYNNTQGSTTLGGATLTSSSDNWTSHANFGADLELGLGRNVGLLIRPDWTFATNDTFFTGTIGFDLPLS